MPNDLFNLLGKSNAQNDIVSQFYQFSKTINGDPRQIVQGLLNSGKMSQQQFNQLQAMATQFQRMLK